MCLLVSQIKTEVVSILLKRISLKSLGSSSQMKLNPSTDMIIGSDDFSHHHQLLPFKLSYPKMCSLDHPLPMLSMSSQWSDRSSKSWWRQTTTQLLKICLLLQLVLLVQPVSHNSSIAHYISSHHDQPSQHRLTRTPQNPRMMFVTGESEQNHTAKDGSMEMTNISSISLLENIDINNNYNISINHDKNYDNDTRNNCDINPSLDFSGFDFPGKFLL